MVHPPLKKSFQTPCISFTQTCVANGARAGAKVIKVALDVPHNSQISSWLGLRPGDKAVRILRVRNLDEVPCVIEDNFFPVSYAYLLDINWEDRSIYDYLLNENKVSVLPGSLIMRIMRADEQAVKYLHVKKNTPLLHMTGFTRCADDSILHTCEQIGYNEDFEFILR